MAHFPSMVLMFYFDFPLGALCLHWHRHLFWSFLLPTSLQCVSRLCLSFYAQLCSSFFPMSHRCYCMCLSCFFLFGFVFLVILPGFDTCLFSQFWIWMILSVACDVTTSRKYVHDYQCFFERHADFMYLHPTSSTTCRLHKHICKWLCF